MTALQRAPGVTRAQAALGSVGALCCGAAVALAAIALHALHGEDAQRASLSAAFAFGHGLALVALARQADTRVRMIGLVLLALGVLFFSGSLAAAAMAGLPTGLAPTGGGLLMLGWAVIAVGFLRG